MVLAEIIQREIQKLPEDSQTEVLKFIRSLQEKDMQGGSHDEDREWMYESLATALRGIEEESLEYTVADLKVVFE